MEAVNDMEPETAQEAVARYQIREIRGRRGNEAKRRRVEAANDLAGWVGVANATDDADFISSLLPDPTNPFEAFRCNSGSQQAGSLNAPGALKRKR